MNIWFVLCPMIGKFFIEPIVDLRLVREIHALSLRSRCELLEVFLMLLSNQKHCWIVKMINVQFDHCEHYLVEDYGLLIW